MKRTGLRSLLIGIALLTANYVGATDSVTPPKVIIEQEKNSVSSNALQAYWVFSGIVTNENGEHYDYYFQMQRKDTQFHALATLIDSQSKAVLLFEESDATVENFVATNWHVGKIFMHFNPINNSWVFGVKTKENKGFNFKVDMLGQTKITPLNHDLRSGVELSVNQTGRLNGHLQTDEKSSKDQFVTAAKAWFKQIWVSKSQDTMHPLTGVLCQFNDGSGFYAVNLQEPDALRGAVAGWRDVQGTAIPMSQFVSIKENEAGQWSIQISSPKVLLSLQDALAKTGEKHQLIAGLTEGDRPGFCTISRDEIGGQVVQAKLGD
ncbi:hypothetical protein BN59_01744 [Legionella massiliensis]|uniref:Uncharacterized protein n=1 Tax=Legionella massiliensis TaxID=1034943 RepID=A0A078KWY1_9GAMM|nr:hypothetical protein [Legionella massiliensis]CDZ77461.1 hypothetical protein BN59_01744 [Legionella massiliensis]CEE13199.1 hypothetical protein BN1094_01744 [Legionella massiliensis]